MARQAQRLTREPPVGAIEFGDLRRLHPISREWGFDRGEPIDRFFIHHFLSAHAGDVRGRVLEIGNPEMTRRFGGDRVSRSDVLHVADSGPPVTVIGDLADGATIPGDAFDCVIVTQTLQLIYDTSAAARTLHRILRPGGVALVTVPAITGISRHDMDRWGQYWSFTTRSARRIFEAVFADEDIEVEAYGNVLAATAFLHGIAAGELSEQELLHRDPDYETLIGIRAQRRAT
jgi:SAM-dependent methyltransferase